MSNRWVLGGALLLFTVFVAACVIATLKIDVEPVKEQGGKRPVRTQNLGEGIRVTQHGLYGVDLVSIGRAHMRKLRKGPFTIGAVNEMVLEEVSLALPEALWNPDAAVASVVSNGVAGASSSDAACDDRSPRSMLAKLGINAGSLKMGGKIPRFSALSIRNLKVSRIDGTNVVPWFAANTAKSERSGLALHNGFSVEGGRSNSWKEAFLVVSPRLKLFSGIQ